MPLRQRFRSLVRGARGLGLGVEPVEPRQYVLADLTIALERGAAKDAVDATRSTGLGPPPPSLDTVTYVAYQQAYPSGPTTLDFYNDSHLPWIDRWIRIRDWVDYWRHRPTPAAEGFAQPALPFADPPPLQTLGYRFAQGIQFPTWPVHSTDHRGCTVNYLDIDGGSHGMRFQRFMASRGPTDKYHRGHDCIANPGDLVVAPERGTIVGIAFFFAGTDVMNLLTDTGLLLRLGEIAPGSADEFGVGEGTVVGQGDPVARIGEFDVAYRLPFHMLHFETWTGNRDETLNPTAYLLRARDRCFLPPPELDLAQVDQGTEQIEEIGRLVTFDAPPGFPH